MSSLIWVLTVCKSYQQTTLEDKELTSCKPMGVSIKSGIGWPIVYV